MNLGFTSCISLGVGFRWISLPCCLSCGVWLSPPSLKIYAFPLDKALCVVAALDCDIERTSIWRE